MNVGNAYKYIIDPLLSGIHEEVLAMIPEESDVLDVACGTGTLAIKMCKRARSVTGIDLSDKMINVANKAKNEQEISNVQFHVVDATQPDLFKAKQFDLATLSLAVHQFSMVNANEILNQLKSISDQILIIDYSSPLPNNIYKPLVYLIERMAGKEHFTHFKKYQQIGGISEYIKYNSLVEFYRQTAGRGIFTLVKCK
jgi:demethylmenaquinone methyltransferase/2-methoxy-6-polyprenyl-1,4-benzoquinol methylase